MFPPILWLVFVSPRHAHCFRSLTDGAGLLASFSFTLLFSTCSLIAGRAVDVVSRKTATVASCLVWSAMAAGTAFASDFPSVFGLRVLQGSAQAFTVSGSLDGLVECAGYVMPLPPEFFYFLYPRVVSA